RCTRTSRASPGTRAPAAPSATGPPRSRRTAPPPSTGPSGRCATSVRAAIGDRGREGEGTTMKTYAEMTAELEQLAAHNDRLTAGLRSARAQIVELKNDLRSEERRVGKECRAR